LQSVSLRQPHVADAVTHVGVVACDAHSVLLIDEHWPHWPASVAPVGWHAGSAAVGHESGPGFCVA